MEMLFVYFLKSSGLLLTFFAAYYFLLRKETFFNSNRWFLLTGMVLSVTLPLFFIKKMVVVEVSETLPQLAQGNTTLQSPDTIIHETIQTDWYQIGFYIYGLIAAVLLLKVIFNLLSLFKILNTNAIRSEGKLQFIDTNKNIAPFSFFNFIVFNSSLYTSSELQSILLHEKIHSTQKHSFDVIITHLFAVIFWFNPFMYWYKKAVIQNLEYIADSEAVTQTSDIKSYQMALLKVVSNQNCLPITNHFYQSLIKKRIIMLNKNQSHQKNSWKYAAVLPALVAFVFLFQVKIIAQEKKVKLEDGATISTNTRQVADYTWTKNATDAEFKNDSEAAMASGIVFNFSDILRNSKAEITTITISYSDNLGNVFAKTFSDKNGIEPIHFVRDIDKNGKGKLGFYTDLKTVKTPQSKIEKKIPAIAPTATDEEKNMLYVINGKEYFQKDVKGVTLRCDGSVTHLDGKEGALKYGSKGKDGVLIFNGYTTLSKPEEQEKKVVVFSNDNGDDIVYIRAENSLKVPSYPSARLTPTSPLLIVDGVEKLNAAETLKDMDLQNIKSIRVYDASGKVSPGSEISKIVLTTKK